MTSLRPGLGTKIPDVFKKLKRFWASMGALFHSTTVTIPTQYQALHDPLYIVCQRGRPEAEPKAWDCASYINRSPIL